MTIEKPNPIEGRTDFTETIAYLERIKGNLGNEKLLTAIGTLVSYRHLAEMVTVPPEEVRH